MNRVDRAIQVADMIQVDSAWVQEANALARERLASGQFRSLAAAQTSAARTVAARHKTMPGPILVAMMEEAPPTWTPADKEQAEGRIRRPNSLLKEEAP